MGIPPAEVFHFQTAEGTSMSDGFELPPRLGPGVLGEEEFEAQKEQHSQRGTLGTAFTPRMLGSAFDEEVKVEVVEKPKRKRKPKGEAPPAVVDGATDATDEPPADSEEATEDEEEEGEGEGEEDTSDLPL